MDDLIQGYFPALKSISILRVIHCILFFRVFPSLRVTITVILYFIIIIIQEYMCDTSVDCLLYFDFGYSGASLAIAWPIVQE